MRKTEPPPKPEQFMWQDFDTEQFHIFNNIKCKEIMCTKDGQKIKKFKLDTTGVATSAERKLKDIDDDIFREIEEKQHIYSPQPQKFEGYANFPRPVSKQINPIHSKRYLWSHIKDPHPQIYNEGFMDKRNQNAIRNDSTAFKTNNVGVSHLTGSLSLIKKPKEERSHLISALAEKLSENNIK